MSESFLVKSPDNLFIPEQASQEDRMLAASAREFMEKEIIPISDEIESKKHGLLRELIKKAADLGFTSVGVDESYGGLGMGEIAYTVLAEKLFGGQASYGITWNVNIGIGRMPLAYYGTEEQKKRLMPKICSGDYVTAYALTEAEAGSDALGGMKTKAIKQPDGNYLLNGQKIFITNGGISDLYTVFARLDEGFAAFLVEKGMKGFSTGKEENKLGLRGSSTTTLFFDDVRIPKENLLYNEGQGHYIALTALDVGRFDLAAAFLGEAKYDLANAIKYSKERRQFGKAIAEFGMTQKKLAKAAAQIYAAESGVYRFAGKWEKLCSGLDRTAADYGKKMMDILRALSEESSILKTAVSDILAAVVDDEVQIYGGNGFMEDYPAARSYRDERVFRIFEGTNEINRTVIAKMLTKQITKGKIVLETAPANIDPNSIEGARALLNLAYSKATEEAKLLNENQEVVGYLSDMTIMFYLIESAYLRAKKTGDEIMLLLAHRYSIDSFSLFLDSMNRLAKAFGSDKLENACKKAYSDWNIADEVKLNRKISALLLEKECYPLGL